MNEWLRENVVTQEDDERELQHLIELAKQYKVYMRVKSKRDFFEPEIKQEFCKDNDELDRLFSEDGD